MALEQYAAEQEKAASGGKTPEKQETLKNILADSKKSIYFSQMLEAEGQDELAKRLSDNKLDAADFEELESMRAAFIERGKNAEAIVAHLKPEMMEQISKRSPEMQKILSTVGAEGFAQVMQKQLLEVAYADPSVFRDVTNAVTMLNDYRSGDFKAADEEISGLVKKAGIQESAFAKLMQEPDDATREAALQKAIYESYDGWGKVRDFIPVLRGKGSAGWAKELAGRKADIDNALGELDTHIGSLGSVLHTTISDNDSITNALARELRSEKQQKEIRPEMSFKAAQAAKRFEDEESSIDQRWAQYKRANNAAFGSNPDNVRNDFRTIEKQRYQKSFGNVSGLWATIRWILYGEKLDSKNLA
jgi:hypothetical protein